VRSAHSPPKIVNGKVETPAIAWLAPAMMKRTPVASAQ
jgi:hypothetical protein